MNADKLNLKELEQVNGGNLLEDKEEFLKKHDHFKDEPTTKIPLTPYKPEQMIPDPVIACGEC